MTALAALLTLACAACLVWLDETYGYVRPWLALAGCSIGTVGWMVLR